VLSSDYMTDMVEGQSKQTNLAFEHFCPNIIEGYTSSRKAIKLSFMYQPRTDGDDFNLVTSYVHNRQNEIIVCRYMNTILIN